jgi:hypothetical protein
MSANMNIISDVVVCKSTSTLRSTLFQKVMGFMTEISTNRGNQQRKFEIAKETKSEKGER